MGDLLLFLTSEHLAIVGEIWMKPFLWQCKCEECTLLKSQLMCHDKLPLAKFQYGAASYVQPIGNKPPGLQDGVIRGKRVVQVVSHQNCDERFTKKQNKTNKAPLRELVITSLFEEDPPCLG